MYYRCKKIVQYIIILSLIVGCVFSPLATTNCFAQKEDAQGPFIYENLAYIIENQEITIVEGTGITCQNVVIPSQINGLPVTKIGKNAFDRFVKSVTIPGSVKVIESHAFGSCKFLKNITLHEGLETIENGAFYKCPIKEFSFPDSVKHLGRAIFGFKKLKKIELPKNLVTMDLNAFDGCKFYSISKKNKHYSTKKGVLFNKKKTKLILFPNRKTKSYSVPKGVKKIGEYAFYGSKIKNVSLPKGVKGIGKAAFAWSRIKSVSFQEGMKKIGARAFKGCNKLKNIYGFDYVETLGNSTFEESGLVTIKLPKNLKVVPDNAFAWCNLKSVIFPKNLKVIGRRAFLFCNMKQQISLPDNLEKVGESAFAFCYGLEIKRLPKSLKSIGKDAFQKVKILG